MTAMAYPLKWPDGWTRSLSPAKSRFDCNFNQALGNIKYELDRMGVDISTIVYSTNLELRKDGLPRMGRGQPFDRGVAVYWMQDGAQKVIACDRWDTVKDNLRAIEKTLEALRGIDRWGTSDIVNKAFAGFNALPAPAVGWRETLGHCDTLEQASAARNRMAMGVHPDRGGSDEAMKSINAAWSAAKEEFAR